ncbi:MAG: hypothetical protein ACI8W8_004122 [Rhodothermales bacterium]|jgi:hypothetical protein
MASPLSMVYRELILRDHTSAALAESATPALRALAREMVTGLTVVETMERLPRHFPRDHVRLLLALEDELSVGEALEELAALDEEEELLLRKVRPSMTLLLAMLPIGVGMATCAFAYLVHMRDVLTFYDEDTAIPLLAAGVWQGMLVAAAIGVVAAVLVARKWALQILCVAGSFRSVIKGQRVCRFAGLLPEVDEAALLRFESAENLKPGLVRVEHLQEQAAEFAAQRDLKARRAQGIFIFLAVFLSPFSLLAARLCSKFFMDLFF